ncbi:uncharacterized protein, partial [Halyomorpha halys]|uniref:uncharacterized protein n=1 Tax=Halyomorpha halys TaxID=286706 RepID=UPI0034D18BED
MPKAMVAYNHSVHTVTGFSPFEVLFGLRGHQRDYKCTAANGEEIHNNHVARRKLWEKARGRMEKEKSRRVTRENLKVTDRMGAIKIGTIVYRKLGSNRGKEIQRYEGPFRVIIIREHGFIKNFDLALERHTGFYPPLVFNHKKFVGDHVDVVNAYRFNRLDLLLEPPLIPHYHIVIVGTGHGARSIISELEGSNTGLRIALIDINPSSPDKIKGKSTGKTPRDLLWKALKIATDSNDDPSEFWSETTKDNMDDKEDIPIKVLCEATEIDFYRGHLQFLNNDTVSLKPVYDESGTISSKSDSYSQTINILGNSFIICTGFKNQIPEFPGSEFCLTIDNFISGLQRNEIPSTALIIASCPEAFETAYLICNYGGKVNMM